jgi:peptidoglycan/xylan/chitin deacetylase (PgdA/CDA1 family)
MAHAVRSPSSSLLAPSIHRGSPLKSTLALTFDDGPSEGTEDVLDLLQKYRVPATFFQCGMNVSRLPQVSLAVVAEGHEIGNHSHSHARLYFRSRAEIEMEFARAQEVIDSTIGIAPRLMRPPFGVRWFGFREVQQKLRLMSIMWTVIALDWKLKSASSAMRATAVFFVCTTGGSFRRSPIFPRCCGRCARRFPRCRTAAINLKQ